MTSSEVCINGAHIFLKLKKRGSVGSAGSAGTQDYKGRSQSPEGSSQKYDIYEWMQSNGSENKRRIQAIMMHIALAEHFIPLAVCAIYAEY